ncbi:hypothetical protein Bbelb_109460 [Branchiostoma belcheri]|nr:hypothetical protein Bbelb_109460 [Branchiostoma belcheri]
MAPRNPPPHEQRQEESGRVEPVFVQTSDIAINTEDAPLSCLEICLAAEDVSGPISIIGAQPQGRGNAFWRLYPQTVGARLTLLQAGAITLRGQEASLLDKNPYVVRPDTASTRVVVSNIPLSYDNKEIAKTLRSRGYKLTSRVIDERARNKDGKLTRFLTGRRFLYIEKPSTPLPRRMSVGLFQAEFYHREQKEASQTQRLTCSNCLETGHHKSVCDKPVVCVQCKKPGHKRGDPACNLGMDSEDEQSDGNSCVSDEQDRETSPDSEEPTAPPSIVQHNTRSRSKSHSHKNNDEHKKQKKTDDTTNDKPTEMCELSDSTQPTLENWLKEQRQSYSKQKQGTKGSITLTSVPLPVLWGPVGPVKFGGQLDTRARGLLLLAGRLAEPATPADDPVNSLRLTRNGQRAHVPQNDGVRAHKSPRATVQRSKMAGSPPLVAKYVSVKVVKACGNVVVDWCVLDDEKVGRHLMWCFIRMVIDKTASTTEAVPRAKTAFEHQEKKVSRSGCFQPTPGLGAHNNVAITTQGSDMHFTSSTVLLFSQTEVRGDEDDAAFGVLELW